MTSLVADAFCWAISDKHTNGQTTIVQVSTVFGEDPDYWTLAVVGLKPPYQRVVRHHEDIVALVFGLDHG